MGACTVHFNLFHHGKRNAKVELAKAGNVRVAARILTAKLIAWKTHNAQALRLVGLVEFFKPTQLRCKSAGTGGVHNQHDLPTHLIKRQALTIHLDSFKVINGFHATLFCSVWMGLN